MGRPPDPGVDGRRDSWRPILCALLHLGVVPDDPPSGTDGDPAAPGRARGTLGAGRTEAAPLRHVEVGWTDGSNPSGASEPVGALRSSLPFSVSCFLLS